MTRAFVIGNGQSRAGFDLQSLRPYGKIYACNAVYREFTPDVLVATDRPIAEEIQKSGYALKNKFYTRRPLPDLGAQTLQHPFWPYSSGPNAIGLACLDNATQIYLIGFDVGSTHDKLNNLYVDTPFYKTSDFAAVSNKQWITQLTSIFAMYPSIKFTRVVNNKSVDILAFNNISNLTHCQISDFLDWLNNVKG